MIGIELASHELEFGRVQDKGFGYAAKELVGDWALSWSPCEPKTISRLMSSLQLPVVADHGEVSRSCLTGVLWKVVLGMTRGNLKKKSAWQSLSYTNDVKHTTE
jgi:hypothetical protein